MSDILLPLHLITLGFIFWTIIHADHLAFNWIRGKVATLPKEKVQKYHRNTWMGLGGMILTGFLLFWPMREFLLGRPQFYAKMAFVVTLVANGFVIGHLQKIALLKSFKQLTFKEKIPLFISGGVSTLAWIGAALGGLFLIPD